MLSLLGKKSNAGFQGEFPDSLRVTKNHLQPSKNSETGEKRICRDSWGRSLVIRIVRGAGTFIRSTSNRVKCARSVVGCRGGCVWVWVGGIGFRVFLVFLLGGWGFGGVLVEVLVGFLWGGGGLLVGVGGIVWFGFEGGGGLGRDGGSFCCLNAGLVLGGVGGLGFL